MTITALPTPPSRNDPTNFATRADSFLAALPTFAEEANQLASDSNLALTTANAIAEAAASSLNADKWLTGTSYTEGDVVWSPTDYRVYRRKVTGAGTVDPISDSTNWALIGNGVRSLKIFSQEGINAQPVSALDSIVLPSNIFDTGTGVLAVQDVVHSNSLFIASAAGSSSFLATSPDGETWTTRSVSSSLAWRLGASSTDAMAISGTSVKYSSNGVTWVNKTNLGSSALTGCRPVKIGSRWLVAGAIGSVNYSDDNGTAWTTGGLPVNRVTSTGVYKVGSSFIFFRVSSSLMYASTTGETGSWTSTDIGVTPALIWTKDDVVYFTTSIAVGSQVYMVDSPTSITAITGVTLLGSSTPVLDVLGTYASFSTTLGASASWHQGVPTLRVSSVSIPSASPCISEAGGVFVAPTNSGVITISSDLSASAAFI